MFATDAHNTSRTTSRLGYVVFFVLVCTPFAFSQINLISDSGTPARIGIRGSYGANISNAYIVEFNGQEFCGVFEEGAAPGISFGVFAELPFGNSTFSFLPSVSYQSLSSRFQTNPFRLEHAFDLGVGDTVRIDRQREYQTSISTIALGASAAWRPIERFRFDAGLTLGSFTSAGYTKTEHLLTPDVVYTTNNRSTLELEQGEVSVHSFILSLITGVSYDIAFSDDVAFSPRVNASIPLTPISGTGSNAYRTWSVSAGAELSVALRQSQTIFIPPIPPELPTSPPVEKPIAVSQPDKSVLRVKVRAVGLTNSGEEVPEPVVAIQNVRVTDLAPTLNYIFFDDGQAEIASRYDQIDQSAAKNFEYSAFNTENALEIHHSVLNIIGKRLQESPQAKITITGTKSLHSNGDSTSEANLALARAQNVASYLQRVWGISSSRIRIKSRGLPESPSDDNTNSGQAENRRVEISTSFPEILDPLETRRIERTATPPRIAFYNDIVSDTGIQSLQITIKQGDKIIERIDGLTDERRKEQLWNIPSDEIASGSSDSVLWVMDIVDNAGNSAQVSGAINVKLAESTLDLNKRDTVIDKSIERFQLILFDYSSVTSSLDNNVDALLDRVSSSVSADAKIFLVGYTDITGDAAYNERLSLDRASKTSLLLSSKLKSLGIRSPQFTLEGRGSRELLYDNTHAEGRFLSRTVRISVEKDIK